MNDIVKAFSEIRPEELNEIGQRIYAQIIEQIDFLANTKRALVTLVNDEDR